jgi:hypothetical protein
MATEPRTAEPNGGRIAFTVATAIFAAGAFGGLFGLGLLIGWFDNEDGGIHRVHNVGFGVLYGVILTVAFLAMTRRRGRKSSAFFQVVATAIAALIAALASADSNYLFFGLVVAAAAGILLGLHPAREEVLRPAVNPSPVMGVLALGGSIPLVWFGLTMAKLQRMGLPTDPHVKMDHWANMAAMAFGLVLTGLLASSRMRGWRVTAWCAGVGVAVYGLASVVFHGFGGTSVPYPGSEGIAWGVVAVVGSLAFIATSEWEARRSQAG